MSRYIDADSIEYYNPSFYGLESLVSIQEDNDLIVSKEDIEHECPTVDVVEVVRCKDCEWWDEEEHNCTIRDSYGWDYKPNDYCSYGERKEND